VSGAGGLKTVPPAQIHNLIDGDRVPFLLSYLLNLRGVERRPKLPRGTASNTNAGWELRSAKSAYRASSIDEPGGAPPDYTPAAWIAWTEGEPQADYAWGSFCCTA
jgi:hypothetical protein